MKDILNAELGLIHYLNLKTSALKLPNFTHFFVKEYVVGELSPGCDKA